MENFMYYSPTRFIFGRGKEDEAGALIKAAGGTRVLIHYGGGSAVRSGLIDRISDSLKRAGLEIFLLGGVQANPKSGLVYEGVRICREENIDFILAAGGGSVIDSAKAIAMGACYDGDFWDFFSGKAQLTKILPVGTVLTIAASGSEGSDACVITQEETGLKRTFGGDLLRPVFSIMNPELTTTLPAYQTACGIVDMMSHIFERYFTNSENVEVTDRMCEGLLKAIIHEAKKVMKNPKNYDARANLMWAGTMAHNDICGVGRIQDWATHNMEHELSTHYNCAHGAGLAVLFPAWMKYVMHHDINRFAQLAVRVWGCEMDFQNPQKTAEEGVFALERFWKSLDMPSCLEDLGGNKADIPKLLESLQIDGRTEGAFVVLDRVACEQIYSLACKEKE